MPIDEANFQEVCRTHLSSVGAPELRRIIDEPPHRASPLDLSIPKHEFMRQRIIHDSAVDNTRMRAALTAAEAEEARPVRT